MSTSYLLNRKRTPCFTFIGAIAQIGRCNQVFQVFSKTSSRPAIIADFSPLKTLWALDRKDGNMRAVNKDSIKNKKKEGFNNAQENNEARRN